ncbi:hypothetical protein KY284_000791 [Solanum tuberosum]|nr:hypothetical protein KY284_000791 [Solanum tuberosum]
MDAKGKNVAGGSGTMQSRKGVAARSSRREPTNLSPQKFGKQVVIHYGEKWQDCQPESKYMGNKYVDEGQLLEDFPYIHAQVRALGLHYIFVDQVCRLVEVTRNKAHDQSQEKVLTSNRQSWDDSSMGCMFGMDELQLWIGGRPVTEDEMATLAERYPLTDSTIYMCRMGPVFQEPVDGDDSTTDKEDGSEKDESDDV